MDCQHVDGAPQQSFNIDVEADKLRAIKIFVAAPSESLNVEQLPFTFQVTEKNSDGTPEIRSYKATFRSPHKDKSP